MVRHRKMLAPINSIKHYVHRSQTGIASGAILNIIVASAAVAPAVGNAFDVNIGSILKALYIEIWYVNDSASGNNNTFTMTIEKRPANATAMTFAQSANLGSYNNKANIFYATQGVQSADLDGSNSIPLFRGWIKIPKGKQRMAQGDEWVVNFAVTAGTQGIVCGLFTYKEYQ